MPEQTQIPSELREIIEQGYDEYLVSMPSRMLNKPLRSPDQTFADAMCEGSIVKGFDNGHEILEAIRNAGVM